MMRDLDIINPRPKMPSSALPPEVRAKLGLGGKGRSASQPPLAPMGGHGDHDAVGLYKGAVHAEPKVGKSGAGTNWVNPNGHAFVKRGSGVPMSKRASGQAKMEKYGGGYGAGAGSSFGAPQVMEAQGGYGGGPAARANSQPPSRERRQLPRMPRNESKDRLAPSPGGYGGGYAQNAPQNAITKEEFEPSDKFDGEREGMVFKKAQFGLGYYPDVAVRKAAGAACRPASGSSQVAGAACRPTSGCSSRASGNENLPPRAPSRG